MGTIPVLMANHIKVVSDPIYAEYFKFNPRFGSYPTVAFDVETPSIGGPKWYWECPITAWSIYSDSTKFLDRIYELAGDKGLVSRTSNGLVYRWSESQRNAIQAVLNNSITVYHNSSFDLQRLGVMGFKLPKPGQYQDTLILAYVLGYKDRGFKLSLEALAPLVNKEKIKVKNEDFDNVTDDVLARCLSDTEITYLLYQRLSKELETDTRVKDHYTYVDLPFSLIVREMQDTGLFGDRTKLNNVLSDTTNRRDKCLAKLLELQQYGPDDVEIVSKIGLEDTPLFCSAFEDVDGYEREEQYRFKAVKFTEDGTVKYLKDGITANTSSKCTKFVVSRKVSFNPNSDANIRFALQSRGWIPNQDHEKTEGGLLKVGETQLVQIEKTSKVPEVLEFVRAFREYKKAQKLLSTYLEKYEVTLNNSDRIRCNFNQCLTRTGRLSSSNPNLQNIPAKGPMGKLLRSIFIAPKGQVLIIGDDSQIEARILADALTRHFDDDRLAKAFRDGIDIHMANAFNWGLLSLVCGDDDDPELLESLYNDGVIDADHEVLERARNLEKTALYGVIYGAGANKLGNGNTELGQGIVDAMSEGAPGIQKFKNAVVSSCLKRKNKAVYNIFGRRGLYPELNNKQDKQAYSRALRQLVNYVIQSSSFSRCASKAIQAYPHVNKLGGKFAAMSHDEFMIYGPPNTARDIKKRATIVFSNPDSLEGCPARFKFKLCRTWADK